MNRCVWCGVTTSSPERVCRGCVNTERRAHLVPDDTVALRGGRWVMGPRRVLVWEPTLQDADANTIACYRCGALAHQTCRSKNGHRTQPHQERHIPRCCPCGGKIERGHLLCAGCKVTSNRRTTAEWTERRKDVA